MVIDRPVDLDALSQNQSEELRDLITVTYNDKGNELGDFGLMSASSIINPDYGVSPPYFSASIPFAGSNLYLTTQQSEPFVAVYRFMLTLYNAQNIVNYDGLSSGTNATANTLPYFF